MYIFNYLSQPVSTHQTRQELRSTRPDVLDGVKDVYFLLHLHVFDEETGGTQHSTASRSVSGDNKNVLHTALHSESLRLWGTTRMCYTQHSTASRSVSGDNKNVLHTALHSESLRLWGQQECVTHSTPQGVAPSLGTTRMCYTQHYTASRSVSGDNKNVLHTALHSRSLRLWGKTRMCYTQHSTASRSVSGGKQECVTHSTTQRVAPSLGQQECVTHNTPQRVAPSLGDNKNVLHTALHRESFRLWGTTRMCYTQHYTASLWGQQECVTHSTPQRVAPSLGQQECVTQSTPQRVALSLRDNKNVLHTAVHSESVCLWGTIRMCYTKHSTASRSVCGGTQ